MLTITYLLAILLDLLLGEPKRCHPLVGFGLLATKVESFLNREKYPNYAKLLLGMLAWFVLILPMILIVLIFNSWFEHYWGNTLWVDVLILYFAIGFTSLRQHVTAVIDSLTNQDLEEARQRLSLIVSRETQSMDEQSICRSTIESVLENGNDAVFAPIFWFVVGGTPGVLVYRLANTLDAMWGYKSDRFLLFGRFTAKMDDILNWLPARLVALSYALLGHTLSALRCWRYQTSLMESPAAGVVMVTGAGALELELGGNATYQKKVKIKPLFGRGQPPSREDISSSLLLINKTLLLWSLLMSAFFFRNFFIS